MKAQVESISPVKKRLSVEIPPEEVSEKEQAALKDLRRRVTVPGFRRGKAPLDVLRRLYGERVRADVISRLIEESYQEALRQEEIVPVAEADIQIQSLPMAEESLSYTAVVEVRPRVEPRGYTGLTLKRERVEVDETEVEAELESLRRQRATFEPAPEDHEAAEGDLVVMDYEGTVDGEPLEGLTGEDRSVVLGSGVLIEGFEDALLGVKAGEEREVEVSFPDDYRSPELAGRPAVFRVRVKEVKIQKLPDLDDEFAKEVAQVEGIEELRDRIRDGIRREKERRAESALRERVVDALLEANPFEVPDALVRRQLAHTLERLREDLARRGMSLEDLGMDEARLQETQRAGAERAVRWAFLLQAIADAEGIEVTDDDVDARIREIAEADGRPYPLIRSYFEEGNRIDNLRSALLERKVLDRVLESSTVEEVDPGELQEAGNE